MPDGSDGCREETEDGIQLSASYCETWLTTLTDYSIIRDDNQSWSEIKMLDFSDFQNLEAAGAFPNLALAVGLSRCLYLKPTAPGCTDRYPWPYQADRSDSEFATSVDISLNASRLIELGVGVSPPGLPGGDEYPNRSDVLFNTCQTINNRAYQTLVHEAGHALGIGSFSDGHPFDDDSPFTSMSTEHQLRCSPHPLDILAIYALYQTPRATR